MWVMGAGGVIAAAMLIFIAVLDGLRADPLGIGNPSDGTYQAGAATGDIIMVLIAAGLWAWMARKNYQGRHWARVLSTVFFGLLSAYTLISVVSMAVAIGNGATLTNPLPGILFLLEWLCGLVALILIWLPVSGQYYRAVRAQRAGYAPVPPV